MFLHNLICMRLGRGKFQPGQMGLDVQGVLQGNITEAAKIQRSVLADYFRNEGCVLLQVDRI